jgi:hypothetical protein
MDEETLKKHLLDDITFLSGMFAAYCLDTDNRALFTYGMTRLRLFVEGKAPLDDGGDAEKSLSEELMRSYQ